MLCDHLEGWDGEGGRERQQRDIIHHRHLREELVMMKVGKDKDQSGFLLE